MDNQEFFTLVVVSKDWVSDFKERAKIVAKVWGLHHEL